MPTFLENLAEIHVHRDRAQERQLQHYRAAEQVRQVLEHDWDSSDPYSPNLRPELRSAANDLFHPSFNYHNARPGSRRHGDLPPYYRTEMQHWEIVDTARLLEGYSSTAGNILDVLSQFAIFTGFEYKVVSKKLGEEEKLVEKAQEILDTFIRANDWWSWEVEIFRRTRRDGEAFLYMEPDPVTGLFLLRSIEPEQVKEPQDTRRVSGQLSLNGAMSWKYGILTPRDDTARAEGYWVVSNYNDAKNIGEFVPAEEMIHVRTEWVDRQAKRGVSDFFSVANELHSVKKLLRNLREGATVQAAIAWIREHPEDMDVQPLGSPGDATNVTRSGAQVSSVTYDGPTMLDVSHGMSYTAGPLGVSENTALIEILQAGLRSVGARWQFPEALISGDSSNANLASALVAEGPFVRAMEFRQWHYKKEYRLIFERVLDHAASTGMLGAAVDSVLDVIDVSVEAPPVIARKAMEETQRNEVLHSNRIISGQSWSAREDLDFEEEQANIEEDPTMVSAEEEAEQIHELALIRHGERIPGDDKDAASTQAKGSAETKTETDTERVT